MDALAYVHDLHVHFAEDFMAGDNCAQSPAHFCFRELVLQRHLQLVQVDLKYVLLLPLREYTHWDDPPWRQFVPDGHLQSPSLSGVDDTANDGHDELLLWHRQS